VPKAPDYPWLEQAKDHKFPDQADFGVGTVKALAPLEDAFLTEQVMSKFQETKGQMIQMASPPVISAVGGLKAAFESATDTDVKDLAKGFKKLPINWGTLGSMVVNLANGQTEVAQQQAMEFAKGALKGVAKEAFKNIPILGTLAGFAVDAIFGAFQLATFDGAKLHAQYMDEAAAELTERCRLAYEQSSYIKSGFDPSTGRRVGTPSDLFRPVRYAYEAGSGVLPISSASIYVLLCGGESQGFGFSRKEWEQKNGSSFNITIPPPAAMLALQELTRVQFEAGNFSEQAIYMLTAEMMRRITYWKDIGRVEDWHGIQGEPYARYYGGNCAGQKPLWFGVGDKGSWCYPRGFCETPAHVFRTYRKRHVQWEELKGYPTKPSGSAADSIIDSIASRKNNGQFWSGQLDWSAQLRAAYKGPKAGSWNITPSAKYAQYAEGAGRPKNSALVLKGALVQKLSDGIIMAESKNEESVSAEQRKKALSLVLIAALGGGAYFGGRAAGRLAKKRR
jgi:hypothetical protein